MSDLEDTGEQSPRPLPEILGPISREERGKLFKEFSWKEAIKNNWQGFYRGATLDGRELTEDEMFNDMNKSHWIDKDRLLLVGDREWAGSHNVHRVYYSFEIPNTFREAASLFFDGREHIYVNTNDPTEGSQQLSVDITHSPDNRHRGPVDKRIYPLAVVLKEKERRLDVGFDEDESHVDDVSYCALDQQGHITETVGVNGYDLYDENVNVVSTTGNFRIVDNKEGFILVEEKRGEEFMVRYRIPKKIDVTNIEKLIPQDLIRDAYDAPATSDKWRHADFLEVLGIERGEVETEVPEP